MAHSIHPYLAHQRRIAAWENIEDPLERERAFIDWCLSTKGEKPPSYETLVQKNRQALYGTGICEDNFSPEENWREFIEAIVKDQFQKAKVLIETAPKLLNYVDRVEGSSGSGRHVYHSNVLRVAAIHNRSEMIRLFAGAGASVALIPGGDALCYPLYAALKTARNGEDAANALIDAGANMEVTVPECNRKTLFAIAIQDDVFGVATRMLEKGADVASKDDEGETPLQTALLSEHPLAGPFIQRMVQSGADDSAALTDAALKSLKDRHYIDRWGNAQKFEANVQAAKAAFASRLAAIQKMCAFLGQKPMSHVIAYLA